MSYGTAEAYRALARQTAKHNEELHKRRVEIHKRSRRRSGSSTAADEPLACPRCRTEYALGYDCPDCAEPLVGASMVEVAGVQPVVTRGDRVRSVLIGVVIVCVTLLFIYKSYELVYWLNDMNRIGITERLMMGVP